MTETMEVEERKTRWSEALVTSIIEIPPWDEDMKSTLFYSKMDYLDFQEKEQKRYDKMMAKQIQKMVYDAMGPQLQEAMGRGATPQEIEAMMPQTTEEIFQLLGGLPTPAMPAPLKALPTETLHKTKREVNNNSQTGSKEEDVCAARGIDSRITTPGQPDTQMLGNTPESATLQQTEAWEGSPDKISPVAPIELSHDDARQSQEVPEHQPLIGFPTPTNEEVQDPSSMLIDRDSVEDENGIHMNDNVSLEMNLQESMPRNFRSGLRKTRDSITLVRKVVEESKGSDHEESDASFPPTDNEY